MSKNQIETVLKVIKTNFEMTVPFNFCLKSTPEKNAAAEMLTQMAEKLRKFKKKT